MSGWLRPCWRNRCGPGGTQGAPGNDTDFVAATETVPDREALGRSRGGFTTKIHSGLSISLSSLRGLSRGSRRPARAGLGVAGRGCWAGIAAR